jgi:hypothetical protein
MAGTTIPLGFPYPTGTDRVMDGDNAIQALAESVDNFLADGAVVGAVGITSQNVWNNAGTKLVRSGPLVVMHFDALKSTWPASEGLGVVPVGYRPTANTYFVAAANATGSLYSVYVQANTGLIITAGAATGGGGLAAQIAWYLGN